MRDNIKNIRCLYFFFYQTIKTKSLKLIRSNDERIKRIQTLWEKSISTLGKDKLKTQFSEIFNVLEFSDNPRNLCLEGFGLRN